MLTRRNPDPRAEQLCLGFPRIHHIRCWWQWDDEIHHAVLEFVQRCGGFPTVLEARNVTRRRFSRLAKSENVIDEDGSHFDSSEAFELTEFDTNSYGLLFRTVTDLGPGEFRLK